VQLVNFVIRFVKPK